MSPDPSASPGRPLPATTVDDDAIAALLALAAALHHLCRAKLLDLPARRAYAVGRLRLGLAEIEAG